MMPDVPPPVFLPVPVTMPAPQPVPVIQYHPTVTYVINGRLVVVRQGVLPPVQQTTWRPVPQLMPAVCPPGRP